LPEKYSDKKD